MAPHILEQPAQMAVNAPDRATFSVVAEGEGLSYQWRKNDEDIPGAQFASYTTPPTTRGDDNAAFSVLVSNTFGSIQSEPASLQVTESLMPAISMQPQSTTASLHKHATFKVCANGGGKLHYQWKKNGHFIPGAHSDTYRTPSLDYCDSGSVFSVLISNHYGHLESEAASLTIGPFNSAVAPVIKQFNSNDTHLRSGDSCKLTWNVDGADFISIDNGIGAVSEQGYMFINPRRTTTYTLKARNQFHVQYSSVTVYVF